MNQVFQLRLNVFSFSIKARLQIHYFIITFISHCSYSLYEPKDIVLLEKAVLKDITLLCQEMISFARPISGLLKRFVPDLHMLLSVMLAQMHCLKKALNVRRKKAGKFVHYVCSRW